jgi:hypothetical protein
MEFKIKIKHNLNTKAYLYYILVIQSDGADTQVISKC